MTDQSLFENPAVEKPELTLQEVHRITFLQREMLREAVIRNDYGVLLDDLCRLAESFVDDSVATVMLFNSQRDSLIVENAPSLGADAVDAFNGLLPGDGSCGNAVYHNEPMYVCDTLNDARWCNIQHLAHRFDICSCFSFPVTDGNGEAIGSFAVSTFVKMQPSGFLVALLDTCASICSVIKQRQMAEGMREQVMEETSRAERVESLGVLAGGIAHDFNNLLTAVMGNIELAILKLPDGQARESLGVATKAVSLATELSQKLLMVSKGNDPIKSWRDIGKIVQDAIEFSLHGSNVSYDITGIDSLASQHVEIDPSQVSQVIQNLVINARQAMPEGGVVRVDCFEKEVAHHTMLRPGRYLGLSIADSGEGMTKDVQKHLFDPYFTTRAAGNGLGLFICHSVIKRHGGQIEVESEVGQGTTVTVYLPHEPSDAMVVQDDIEPALTSVSAKNIMIMDDQSLIRDTLRRILEQLGHRVVEVKDGQEALATYQRHREEGNEIDLSILDLTIPGGVGGVETLRRLRELNPQATVLVSSGYSAGESCIDPAKAGFDASVSKPYGVEDVERAIALVDGKTQQIVAKG